MKSSSDTTLYIEECRDRATQAFRTILYQDVALNYLCGECFFPFLMRAKVDPVAAAYVPAFEEAISSVVGSGVAGLKEYLESRNATYWAARATNPDMGRGHRARAAQLLEQATRILLYHEKLDRAALPSAKTGRRTDRRKPHSARKTASAA